LRGHPRPFGAGDFTRENGIMSLISLRFTKSVHPMAIFVDAFTVAQAAEAAV
jgi:hypothetical protein